MIHFFWWYVIGAFGCHSDAPTLSSWSALSFLCTHQWDSMPWFRQWCLLYWTFYGLECLMYWFYMFKVISNYSVAILVAFDFCTSVVTVLSSWYCICIPGITWILYIYSCPSTFRSGLKKGETDMAASSTHPKMSPKNVLWSQDGSHDIDEC